MSKQCSICFSNCAKINPHQTKDAYEIDCPVCGCFVISGTANLIVQSSNKNHRWKFSAWVRQYANSMVTTDDIQTAFSFSPPGIKQRADRMLRWLNEHYPAGEVFSVENFIDWSLWHAQNASENFTIGSEAGFEALVSIGWNHNVVEMNFMLTELLCNELGYLQVDDDNEYQISPKGLIHLEGAINADSTIGFCAMWFNEEVKPLWDQVIAPAIQAAGYEPLRIDSKQHNGKIDDEIMASIRGAKFVVADFTGNRGGVYYEAGFAHGLDLPVIFMCREGDDLHFDIRQYNCIFWKLDNLDDARERLKNRILATLGKGPLQIQ